MRKSLITIAIFPFLLSCTAWNQRNEQSKKDNTTGVDETTNWDSIRSIFANVNYENQEDSWDLKEICNLSTSPNDSIASIYEDFRTMKLSFQNDSTISINGYISSINRRVSTASDYEYYCPISYFFFKDYFSIRGINIKDSVHYIYMTPHDNNFPFNNYADNETNIYTHDYLILYRKDIAACFKYTKKRNQYSLNKNGRLIYSSKEFMKSINATDSIKETSSCIKWNLSINTLNCLNENKINKVTKEWTIMKLPQEGSKYEIVVVNNSNGDFDTGGIYIVKNKTIDNANCIPLSFGSYSEENFSIDEFSIYSDNTIFVRTLLKEGSQKILKIKAYQINNDGEFYELKANVL